MSYYEKCHVSEIYLIYELVKTHFKLKTDLSTNQDYVLGKIGLSRAEWDELKLKRQKIPEESFNILIGLYNQVSAGGDEKLSITL